MAVDLKVLLSLPIEDRQIVQEMVGYSLVNDMNTFVFGPEQKKQIDERIKKYCKKSTAVFKYEDLKSSVLDKFK